MFFIDGLLRCTRTHGGLALEDVDGSTFENVYGSYLRNLASLS